MTPAEATALLEIAPDATAEQLEARFLELRRKLEDKIAKAPTPGLQAKYRASLADITTAFETLTLAADSSTLPVLKREAPKPAPQNAASPAGASASASGNTVHDTPAAAPVAAKKKANSNKEFAVVAIIAVVLLAVGGWFVMKTRAEAETRAKHDALEKAEAALAAEKARLEEKRQTEGARREEELALAGLRAKLAKGKIRWDAIEKELPEARSRLAEIKGDLNNEKDTDVVRAKILRGDKEAHEAWIAWLAPFVQNHPAKGTLAELDALSSAKSFDAAKKAVDALEAGLVEADKEVAAQKLALLATTGELQITSEPSGLTYTLKDAYGRETTGTTPAKVSLPAGRTSLALVRPGWNEVTWNPVIPRGKSVSISGAFTIESLKTAAAAGDAEAQGRLGLCYLNGFETTKDASKGFELLKESAGHGFAASQYNLGVCYADGVGVSSDDAQKIFWYRKAADSGYARAQAAIGACYWLGSGVDKDATQAVFWYRKAADQGDAPAQCGLGDAYDDGVGVSKDQAQAVFWYRKAADQGDAHAQCMLGFRYALGEGVSEDLKQATFWFRKAADQGHAVSQYRIGKSYADGEGVSEDKTQAVFWYRKAADQGNAAAQLALGYAYKRGEGVPKDEAEAIAWFRKAGDKGKAALKRMGQ